MSSSLSTPLRTGIDPSRYWSLIHKGQVYAVDWDDGERLLALSAAVRAGTQPAQEFHCRLHGDAPVREAIAVFVAPETQLELLTESDHSRRPRQSHWFG
jgi:hypothetical protein